MGWIVLRMALLCSLHITMTASAEQTKEVSNKGHLTLESFLKNVWDSKPELTKMENEVRANAQSNVVSGPHSINHENSKPRQRRSSASAVQLAGRTRKDPGILRRVLELYMKRAQVDRYEKDQNIIDDYQQKISDIRKGKREFQSAYVGIYPSGNNLQKRGNAAKSAQEYKHKQSNCEMKKVRNRRWRSKSRTFGAGITDKNEATNDNNDKSNSVVNNKRDNVNNEAAVDPSYDAQNSPNTPSTSAVRSQYYPVSSIVRKGNFNLRRIDSYQDRAFASNSMYSKQSGNADASLSEANSVLPGSDYDLDCVHEIASLKRSLYSGNIGSHSSLIDNVPKESPKVYSSQSLLRSTDDIAIDSEQTVKDSKSVLGDESNNVNPQEKFQNSEPTSPSSDEPPSGDNMAILNPIVLDVLEQVSKTVNQSGANADTEGMEQLPTIDNTSELHVIAKNSSIDNISAQKVITINNEHDNRTPGSSNGDKVTTPGSSLQMHQESNIAKDHRLKDKLELVKKPVSAIQNTSDISQILTPITSSSHGFAGKTGKKQEIVYLLDTKANTSQVQKSKSSESLFENKPTDRITKPMHKPTVQFANPAPKGLAYLDYRKIEKVVVPTSLHAQNHALFPKSKLSSDIVLRARLLSDLNSEKALVKQPKTQNKIKGSEVSLKQTAKHIQHKKENLEEILGIQSENEEVQLQENTIPNSGTKIEGITSKQQNTLASSGIPVGNENTKSVESDGSILTKQTNVQIDNEDGDQDENSGDNQRLINTHKRSLKTNEEKQQNKSSNSGEAQDESQETELNQADYQTRSSNPLRRKRFANRFRKHLRNGKRQCRQERNSNLNLNTKNVLKDYNISPYKNIAIRTNGENGKNNVHQNMLSQVEDMIRSLKQENNLRNERFMYGNKFSHRIGRKLQSVTDEAKDNSDDINDNDDYYYYDEADVDKRKPEHSKVSQIINRKENLGKLNPTSMRKKEMLAEYVQKPSSETEYLKPENPTNIGYSNNDPSLSHNPSEQVPSDLITSKSNKISLFNKEMPEEVREARSEVNNRSISKKERGNNYGGNIMEYDNPHSSSSSRTDEANQNRNADQNIPRVSHGEPNTKNISINESSRISRLNEGHLEQMNKLLNDIVLNQTPTTWDDINQEETEFNAHMRYKRAGNAHKIDTSQKINSKLNVENENISIKKSKAGANTLEKSMTKQETGKENITIGCSILGTALETEDTIHNREAVNTVGSYIKDSSSGRVKSPDDTLSVFMKNTYSLQNCKGNDEATKTNPKAEEKNIDSTLQIPVSQNNVKTKTTVNIQNEETKPLKLKNDASSKNGYILPHLKDVESFMDTNPKDNNIHGMLPEDEIHLNTISESHEYGIKENGDLQSFNSLRNSFDKKRLTPKSNQSDQAEEEMKKEKSSGEELMKKISEHNGNSNDYTFGISNMLRENIDLKSEENTENFPTDTGGESNFVTAKKKALFADHVKKNEEVPQESLQSPSSLTKDKQILTETSRVLMRNKRNDKNYIYGTLQEQPADLDYTSYNENDPNGYSLYNDDVISETENGIILSENTTTPLGVTQMNIAVDAVDTSVYFTSFITTMDTIQSTVSPPRTDQEDKEKILVNEYQSFSMPRDFTDNSQLNDTINGDLACRLVGLVFEAVNASEPMKLHLGGALKKTDHGRQEKQPNYETGISKEMLENEEEQYHQKTGSLLSKVMELLDVLVEEEVNKRSCITLQPELQEFLLWMLELPEPGKLATSDFSVTDNFLFAKRNKHLHENTKQSGSGSKSDLNENMDLKELTQQIELVKELIAQYTELPESEKPKVQYVHLFLQDLLEALERIHGSKSERLHSNYYSNSSGVSGHSKNTLQATKTVEEELKNIKTNQDRLKVKGLPHTVSNQASFKDSKRVLPGMEDNFSKITVKPPTSSKGTSYVSNEYRVHKSPFLVSSDRHSKNKRSKGRHYFTQDLVSVPDNENSDKNTFKVSSEHRPESKSSNARHHFAQDLSSASENEHATKSYFPVNYRTLTEPHKRKRRFGGHGRGNSKSRHRNITHLHVPTMQYKMLIKRAAEFRERRNILH